jgi:hypothetical protein
MNKESILERVRTHPAEPLKDDALYVFRITQFKGLLDLVEDTMKKSGKDLPTVLGAFAKNREIVLNSFPYVGDAFDVLIKDFS